LEAIERYVDGAETEKFLTNQPFGQVSLSGWAFTAEGISPDDAADEAVVLVTDLCIILRTAESGIIANGGPNR
jgi:hypothetical protein